MCYYSPGMATQRKQDPESLGTGLGPLLADYIPLMPSGARRAGAANVMAARIGRDPSFLVKHPIMSQLMAMGVGAAGGAALGSGIAAVVPILAVQAARRHEMQGIQNDYDTQKRKRLRDIPGLESLLGGYGGSERLGAVGAYEAMRKRKYQNIGALSETGDALTLGSMGLLGPLGPLISVPITNGIDHMSADRLRKQADFSEQKNIPSLPLYLLAAALAGGGSALARSNFRNQMRAATPVPRSEWQGIVNGASGGDPPVASLPGLNNAHYLRPSSRDEAAKYLGNIVSDKHNVDAIPWWDKQTGAWKEKLVSRVMKEGLVEADPKMATGSVLGHEGGHARIDHSTGIVNFLQSKVYPWQRLIAPVAGIGSMAAGLASGSTLKGLLAGTGIGLVGGAGAIVPEAMASYYGMKALGDHKGGSLGRDGDVGRQLGALGTYAAANVLPSMLAGAAGGWISGRRKAREEEEPEITDDEDAEKQARWESIRSVADVGLKAMRYAKTNPDMADRIVRESNLAGGASFKQLKDLIYNSSKTLRDATNGRRLPWQQIRDMAEKAIAARPPIELPRPPVEPAATPIRNMVQGVLNL